LLGPTPLGITAGLPDERSDTHPETIRFSSAGDLCSLLARHAPLCDCLIMAAAVADFRPKPGPDTTSKLRRDADGLTLVLEATPDLLAGVARSRRPGQFFVGFALEPRESMIESARAKLTRKGIDLIVANSLETMDSDHIEAVLIDRDPGSRPPESTPGPIPKAEFAIWLLDRIEQRLATLPRVTPGRSENTANDTTATGVSF
jgi:phosphopantothenoylcysteine decarboxylase/phosphopantothenate--cysteine ligase